MSPYSENTENPEYVEFIDCTKEVQSDYEKCVDCFKLPEGRIWSSVFYGR